MYEIEIVPEAIDELRRVRVFDRRNLEKAIERRLRHEPDRLSRNRKILESLVPTFIYEPPLWELRVGTLRIFYDVQKEAKKVIVRAIRIKASRRLTEEII